MERETLSMTESAAETLYEERIKNEKREQLTKKKHKQIIKDLALFTIIIIL